MKQWLRFWCYQNPDGSGSLVLRLMDSDVDTDEGIKQQIEVVVGTPGVSGPIRVQLWERSTDVRRGVSGIQFQYLWDLLETMVNKVEEGRERN